MKTLQIISVSLTGLFMFSTLMCGLRMRYAGELLPVGSKNFHMLSAILTMLLVLITMFLLWRGWKRYKLDLPVYACSTHRQIQKANIMKRLLVLSGIIFLTLMAYITWIRPWHLRWGATEEEVGISLPGDEVAQAPDFNATRAVTVNAPAQDIWPWLVQIGYNRAGWYSYDCIDNLCRPSTEKILSEFQDIAIGNKVPVSPWVYMRVRDFETDHWILWESARGDGTWLWYLDPIDESHTRLISRMRFTYHWESPFILVELISDVGDIFMLRKCMLSTKGRAEASARASARGSEQ